MARNQTYELYQRLENRLRNVTDQNVKEACQKLVAIDPKGTVRQQGIDNFKGLLETLRSHIVDVREEVEQAALRTANTSPTVPCTVFNDLLEDCETLVLFLSEILDILNSPTSTSLPFPRAYRYNEYNTKQNMPDLNHIRKIAKAYYQQSQSGSTPAKFPVAYTLVDGSINVNVFNVFKPPDACKCAYNISLFTGNLLAFVHYMQGSVDLHQPGVYSSLSPPVLLMGFEPNLSRKMWKYAILALLDNFQGDRFGDASKDFLEFLKAGSLIPTSEVPNGAGAARTETVMVSVLPTQKFSVKVGDAPSYRDVEFECTTEDEKGERKRYIDAADRFYSIQINPPNRTRDAGLQEHQAIVVATPCNGTEERVFRIDCEMSTTTRECNAHSLLEQGDSNYTQDTSDALLVTDFLIIAEAKMKAKNLDSFKTSETILFNLRRERRGIFIVRQENTGGGEKAYIVLNLEVSKKGKDDDPDLDVTVVPSTRSEGMPSRQRPACEAFVSSVFLTEQSTLNIDTSEKRQKLSSSLCVENNLPPPCHTKLFHLQWNQRTTSAPTLLNALASRWHVRLLDVVRSLAAYLNLAVQPEDDEDDGTDEAVTDTPMTGTPMVDMDTRGQSIQPADASYSLDKAYNSFTAFGSDAAVRYRFNTKMSTGIFAMLRWCIDPTYEPVLRRRSLEGTEPWEILYEVVFNAANDSSETEKLYVMRHVHAGVFEVEKKENDRLRAMIRTATSKSTTGRSQSYLLRAFGFTNFQTYANYCVRRPHCLLAEEARVHRAILGIDGFKTGFKSRMIKCGFVHMPFNWSNSKKFSNSNGSQAGDEPFDALFDGCEEDALIESRRLFPLFDATEYEELTTLWGACHNTFPFKVSASTASTAYASAEHDDEEEVRRHLFWQCAVQLRNVSSQDTTIHTWRCGPERATYSFVFWMNCCQWIRNRDNRDGGSPFNADDVGWVIFCPDNLDHKYAYSSPFPEYVFSDKLTPSLLEYILTPLNEMDDRFMHSVYLIRHTLGERSSNPESHTLKAACNVTNPAFSFAIHPDKEFALQSELSGEVHAEPHGANDVAQSQFDYFYHTSDQKKLFFLNWAVVNDTITYKRKTMFGAPDAAPTAAVLDGTHPRSAHPRRGLLKGSIWPP